MLQPTRYVINVSPTQHLCTFHTPLNLPLRTPFTFNCSEFTPTFPSSLYYLHISFQQPTCHYFTHIPHSFPHFTHPACTPTHGMDLDKLPEACPAVPRPAPTYLIQLRRWIESNIFLSSLHSFPFSPPFSVPSSISSNFFFLIFSRTLLCKIRHPSTTESEEDILLVPHEAHGK